MKKTMKAFLLGAALVMTTTAYGQNQGPQYQKQESGVPVLTGFVGVGTNFEPGQQEIAPDLSPILLIPIGNWFLFESEGEFAGSYTHLTGQPWDRHWDKGIEYIQGDIFVNRYLTLVGGRFLTPFGTFNERLHPGWIRNFQTAPFITAFEMTDSNGGQARGAVAVNRNLDINYAGYFSASSNRAWFVSDRAAGGRVGLFFPKARFEVGGTYQRKLGDGRRNLVGVDWIWQLKPIPLDIRGEFARDPTLGKGYWIEGAYRMRKVPVLKALMKKSQAEIRLEQFWVSPLMAATGDNGGMAIPMNDATRAFAGWSYWIRRDVRANFAYGREFNAVDGDHNVWNVGITYRFAIPLGGDK